MTASMTASTSGYFPADTQAPAHGPQEPHPRPDYLKDLAFVDSRLEEARLCVYSPADGL